MPRRGVDRLGGNSIRNGCGPRRVGLSWAEMYRKVLSRGTSTCTRPASAASGDRGGLSLLPAASRIEARFRDDGVCRGQVLRDEELAVIRICPGERLPNDQPGSRLREPDTRGLHTDPPRRGKRRAQGAQAAAKKGPSESDQTT